MKADPKVFDRPRWLVIAGPGPLERRAAADAAALIQQHVPYVLQTHVGGCDRRHLRQHNLMLLGTADSNCLIAGLVKDGKLRRPRRPQSYAIRVLPSPWNPRRQVLVLAGGDERGVLYAARDWEHFCYDPYAGSLSPRTRPQPHVVKRRRAPAPFHQPVPEWDLAASPQVPHRGIWTWGHVVYDYHGFLQNMSRWKHNMLICWNDVAPANAREIVDFAHGLGIDVVWGYTWCWGEPVDPSDPAQLEYWRDRVIRTYEEQYLPLGGDGIYFQTFTETHDQKIGRKTVAELATRWVNAIGSALLDRHPGLRLQFGVHAISIGDHLGHLAAVDPRVSLVWEDAGGFPYAYDVADVEHIRETAGYTRRLAGLRGPGEDIGFVFKGMQSLDWPTFEHQLGPFVMGRADRNYIRRRAAMLARRWKHLELGWRKNLWAVCKTIQAAAAARPARLTIAGLVEDALWEEHMWLPPCLLAEALWNPNEKPESIIAKVSATRDAHCLV